MSEAEADRMMEVDGREVVVTRLMEVRCDGGNAPFGHPIEFMTLTRDDAVQCQYCGRRFVRATSLEASRLVADRPA